MPALDLRHLAPILLFVACFQDGPETETGSSGSSSAPVTTTGPADTSTGTPTTGSSTTDASTTSTTSTTDESSDTGSTTADTSTGPTCMTPWYRDFDEDGHGDPDVSVMACMRPDGHVGLGDDCDDMDAARAPGFAEKCDDKDNDCDVLVDEYSPQNVLCKQCSLFAHGDHSYAFCTFLRSWPEARTECKKRSGDLAVIDDADENAALTAQGLITPNTNGGWYIGLSDLAAEGTFVWLDGLPVGYTGWNVGEPNDAAMAEDCTLLPNTGLWNDQGCDPPAHFLCESPAP